MTYRTAAAYFGVAGFGIATALFAIATIIKYVGTPMGGELWLSILWPTAILTMAAEGSGRFAGVLVLLVAVLTNALVYAVVGILITFVRRRFGPS